MLATTSAAALSLPCGSDCPEMAPAAPSADAHACCPGGGETAPDPSTRLERTLPDCCATLGACESEPLIRVDDAELSERFDSELAPPVVVQRVAAQPQTASPVRDNGPAPPLLRTPTATIVLLR